ncbi:phage major capsid protein [Oceanidesulfovibrio marinus]|uniref:Phage major capsid protein n=1 Tax=Oceanidesulfovibrio marinus TaxID=370038 RepID=A0A6P1ZB82_9BACT|nr:phage major capsid protein [Oceanidesulfovibrio marinus]TVM31165.1 phage major capsid protein [Oceanidesulfovibrio marinus]
MGGIATPQELNYITRSYFMADNGKAFDLYFDSSWLMEFGLRQRRGLYERIDGGDKIEVPVLYDGANGGWYNRNTPLNEDDKENIGKVEYTLKHTYANATVYRTDLLQNRGDKALVKLITTKLMAAQESARDRVASQQFNSAADSELVITGIKAMCDPVESRVYAGKAGSDLVAEDGKRAWVGYTNSTPAVISTSLIRTGRSTAKFKTGPKSKPNFGVTTETLFNKLVDVLTVQQRFVNSDSMAKSGFTGIRVDGCDITVDDYCPAGHLGLLNSNFWGWAVHTLGNFVTEPWKDLSNAVPGQSAKIFVDLNMICNARKAHILYNALTAE